jgi:homoserine O-acetyltransferase
MPNITLRVEPAPSKGINHFLAFVPDQLVALISEFPLECGVALQNVEVAYRTWGQLNDRADNCLVICHALTGSSDVEDW